MARKHSVRIEITESNGTFSTTVGEVSDPPVKPGHRIDWFFDAPDTFPAGSRLYLRFFIKNADGLKVDHRGCMNGSQWRQGRGTAAPDGRSIAGRVSLLADGKFPYEIGYLEMLGDDRLLLDPEIVVEGNKRKKRKKKAKKAAKKTAKQQKRKKSAAKVKKAATARKAKRATKRKAKKR